MRICVRHERPANNLVRLPPNAPSPSSDDDIPIMAPPIPKKIRIKIHIVIIVFIASSFPPKKAGKYKIRRGNFNLLFY